jgi:hypothetical protein
MALQRDRITPRPDHSQIPVLVVTPFAEVVLRRRDRQQHKQQCANHAERANRIAE